MTQSITDLLPGDRIIVVCGRADDAHAWRSLFGPDRCLAVALDEAPPERRVAPLRGASDHLAWQHRAIAGLDGSGWLAQAADAFDPDHTAMLVLPDPLDPARVGDRRQIGSRHAAWRHFEDKTVVDTLWDAIGVRRTRSITTDYLPDLGALGMLVDGGSGVVCSFQPVGAGPAAGGDGIWWWRHGQPPAAMPTAGPGAWRVRLMPLLEGVPVRLHGLVLTHHVVAFPPMEIVTLPRPDHGTLMYAGTVPALGHRPDLLAQTKHLGAGLRGQLGYRGGFSVDGVLTVEGFRPTNFNARLTSAMEGARSELRVVLHSVNLLARDGTDLKPTVVERLAEQVFDNREEYTLYGAATCVGAGKPRHVAVRWAGRSRLVVADGPHADGRLEVTPSVRGWLLTATLTVARLPLGRPVGRFAPEIFRLSDRILGTAFGNLASPFGICTTHVPAPRVGTDSVEARARPT
ncbi:MAG: hypothetical protein HYR62_07040 [Actinobacteria bacterium]|nr:hypothetical protein [Actinomycetota bacterium]MBI3685933.1 hypothetical protein [Actinomycetota bacterium]